MAGKIQVMYKAVDMIRRISETGITGKMSLGYLLETMIFVLTCMFVAVVSISIAEEKLSGSD